MKFENLFFIPVDCLSCGNLFFLYIINNIINTKYQATGMQRQNQINFEKQTDKKECLPESIKKTKTKINMDCIKVCPLDKSLWAFAYYQQSPQFCGGVQVLHMEQIINQNVDFGAGIRYLEVGPIMHIEWLSRARLGADEKISYYILAAARNNEAIICKYTPQQKQLTVEKRIVLGTEIFCLYCDWQPLKTMSTSSLMAICALSSNQSTVYTFKLSINEEIEVVSQITEYSKHEYAVWACKINKFEDNKILMVAGDEVDCLYLYDLSLGLIGKNKTAHSQGICQIIWRTKDIVMSGSFDGSIAEISVSNFAQIIRKFTIQGTIWRIIPLCPVYENKSSQTLLICNSSIKKFQLIQYPESQQWNSGEEHTSLAYAADFNNSIMITASFYDQEVRIWKIHH